ncbi:MAG TPA: zf-HC2 domain-containing protein [Actinomycetota bacterium]|nr:zf-HC2 domain-containing protein [Actinomycetota bacterium]
MEETNHEDFSSRLRAYSQGALDEAEAAEVEAHLSSCAACAGELRVVRLLLTTSEPEMDDLERATLHRDVRSAVIAPAPARTERWGRRLAPALGAAALVALLAVGIVSLDRDTRSTDSSGAATDTEAEAGKPAAEPADPDRVATGRSKAGQTSDTAAGTGGGTGGDAALPEAKSKLAAGSTQAAGVAGAARDRAFVTVVRRSFSEASFDRRSLERAGANANAARSSMLYSSAPAGPVRDVIRRCVETTLATSPFPLRPALATVYRADDIVVITFVWNDASGALNYEIRGWRGGACDRPSPIYRRGIVR